MKYRLVTRSDFDGLVCAALLKELDMIDDIKFVHPKDMQDGNVELSDKDITTNLPYVEGVYLSFDHHLSETMRLENRADNHIIDPNAPSAARVLFNYFGGEVKFTRRWDEIEVGQKFKAPILTGSEEEKTISQYTSIQIRIKKGLMRAVKKHMGNPNMSNKDVGFRLFKYYIKMEGVKKDE